MCRYVLDTRKAGHRAIFVQLLALSAAQGSWRRPLRHNFRHVRVNGACVELGDPTLYKLPVNAVVQFDYLAAIGSALHVTAGSSIATFQKLVELVQVSSATRPAQRSYPTICYAIRLAVALMPGCSCRG